MYQQKNRKKWQRKLFFSLLFIFSLVGISLFYAFDKIMATSQETIGSCTNQYGDWSACGPDGRKTRIVTRSCTGTQPYTYSEYQECTYSLPTCSFTYSPWGACQSSGIRTRTVLTHYPTGCSGGTPITSQNCTYSETILPCSFTYSAWGDCRYDGTQSRTVLTYYPTGCNGGTPITSQNCASYPTAPTCSFTYSPWGACQSNGTQTRVVFSTSPTGCTGGSPEISRNCTYTQQTGSGISGSGSETGQNTSTTPEFTFLNLFGGTTLKGNFTIKGKVDSANGVEFYLVASNSNIPLLIGSAKNIDDNYWELPFGTTETPNGSYYLVAKIKNNYGSEPYEGKRVQIYINNLSEPVGDYPVSSISDTESPASSGIQEESGQDNSSLPQNFNGGTSVDWQKKYFGNENCADKSKCSGESDPDKDGLSNNDEFRYRTDPLRPDTDGDGFLDGDEVKNGFNPLQFSPGDRSDKVVFESPKEIGEIKKELYQVNNVEMVAKEEGEKELRLTGKGLPNSFVTIYIYSDLPVVLTVKTDSEGNWSYVLDKQLEDGEHQVYVAVTDNTGKITAKSEPLFFVKTAEAATVIPSAEASALAKSAAPAEKRRTKDLMVLAGIIILGFITALTAIGFYIVHTNKKTKGLA